jgi:hypothetical protein
MVDPDADPVGADVETEPVAARDGLKRRDVEYLLRQGGILGRQGQAVFAVAKIAMPVAHGVADLGDHGIERIARAKAQPERHRVEHMAKDAGLGHEQDAGGGQLMRRQHLAHPRDTPALTGRAAMVGVVQADETPPVLAEQGRALRILGVQQQVVDAIAEPVGHGTLAAMVGLARDMLDGGHAPATP